MSVIIHSVFFYIWKCCHAPPPQPPKIHSEVNMWCLPHTVHLQAAPLENTKFFETQRVEIQLHCWINYLNCLNWQALRWKKYTISGRNCLHEKKDSIVLFRLKKQREFLTLPRKVAQLLLLFLIWFNRITPEEFHWWDGTYWWVSTQKTDSKVKIHILRMKVNSDLEEIYCKLSNHQRSFPEGRLMVWVRHCLPDGLHAKN